METEERMARPCTPPPQKLMYSIEETACLSGIGRSLLYLLLLEGKGPGTVKVGSRRLIPHAALMEWVERQEVTSTPS
jgi:excisionase family DNA binding protein